MALLIAATPIGNYADLSLRVVDALKSCDLVIGEEKKEVELLLKRALAWPKEYELLNEHSGSEDLNRLAGFCSVRSVVLVSDCGTPGFCDPGSDLVRICRDKGIEVSALPGPSSLMTALSLAGRRIDRFFFQGFLPQENQARSVRLRELLPNKEVLILMDTPYRLKKTLEEVKNLIPKQSLFLCCDLTQVGEALYEGTSGKILLELKSPKAEFVLIVFPQ